MPRRPRLHFLVLTAVAAVLLLLAACLAVSLAGLPALPSAEPAVRRRQTTDPADMPDPGPVAPDALRRGPGGPWTDGPYTYYCGLFRTGVPSTLHAGAASLRALNQTYAVPPQGCLRVYCRDTSAIYVCSGDDIGNSPLSLAGYDIAWMADRLALLCCDAHRAASAQLFHPSGRWNTVVGYGNCRHDPAEPPSAYGTANGGVNGDCVPAASGPSSR